MLKEIATYSVLLLPGLGSRTTGRANGRGSAGASPSRMTSREIAARGLSLRDAEAWMRTYNAVMGGKPAVAVIAEEGTAAGQGSPRQAA